MMIMMNPILKYLFNVSFYFFSRSIKIKFVNFFMCKFGDLFFLLAGFNIDIVPYQFLLYCNKNNPK